MPTRDYRILVPLDGSSRAERAIPVADCLAEALPAEVELLRVVDPADLVPATAAAAPPERLAASVRLAEAYLGDALRRFRLVQPTAAPVPQGPARQLIVQRARAGTFSLIVMTTRGQAGLTGALLGSVARAVVRESEVPVLVLRERVALPQRVRGLRVLVLLDGSAVAEAVLAPLLPLARALGWRLLLCWVATPPPDDAPSSAAPASPPPPSLDVTRYLTRLAARLRRAGVGTEARIECGDRVAAMLRRAALEDVDLVALGAHGRHGVERLAFGSIAEQIILHGSKPVLTVRPRDAAAGDQIGPQRGREEAPAP